MRKTLFILIIVIGWGFAGNAQDIILKKDGLEIESKVLEITDQQIKYRDFDFLNGPVRNIPISEVLMITYENGKKEFFDMEVSLPIMNEDSIPQTLSELKNEFDRIGENDVMMLSFFKRNNYTKYSNDFGEACNMRNKGKKFLATGIGLMIGGSLCLFLSYTVRDWYWVSLIGYAFMIGGEALIIASIPISAVAGAKKKKIKNEFARKYFGTDDYTYTPTLNLGITSNGFGITLNY